MSSKLNKSDEATTYNFAINSGIELFSCLEVSWCGNDNRHGCLLVLIGNAIGVERFVRTDEVLGVVVLLLVRNLRTNFKEVVRTSRIR